MTKIYRTQKEIEADIHDGMLKIDGDVRFECSFTINADIHALNIDARDIHALNIRARNIDALNIRARNIDAHDIDAINIHARNIHAHDIHANHILFFAIAMAYASFKCKSITGQRTNSQYLCLDRKVEITK